VAASSDLYSLGVVLFEMATGRVPFDGDQPVNVALKHVNEPVPHPRFINANITPQMEAVILRAMEKNPDMRYQTADAFLADLDAIEGGTAVQPAVAQTYATPPMAPVDEDLEEKKRKYWPWVLLAVALALTALIAFLALSPGDRITVPDVAGSPVSDARTEIEDAGLQVGEVETEFSDEEPKGTVLDTDPGAGTKVEKESKVDLIVSGGEAPVEVPEFVGSTVAEAQADAKEAGLTLRVREVFSATVDEGTIGAQNPPAGEKVATGETVTVNVSKGVEAITVPAVTGGSVESAKSKLEAAGFTVRVREEDSAEEAGTVTAQAPAAGTEAKEGDTITLTTASGFNSVPALIDQSEDEATDAVAAAGFRVRITETTAQDPSLPIDGKVTAQTPDAGGRLEVGSQVSITVTRPAEDTGTTPTEEPAPENL
jgi:serine/threonine-protein kinase